MKKGLINLGLLLSVLTVLTGCLSNDDTEIITYDDTAIMTFSLGTMTRTIHTTSSKGEDSTYTASVTGSKYAFAIDQQRGLIYNVDSLPVGTRVSNVLCNITTKNSGVAVINHRTKDGLKDSLTTYSNTDSVNFSKPVEVRVYANSGIAYRKYTVTVNVHQQNGDEFCWTKMLDEEQSFAKAERMRMLSAGSKPFVLMPASNGSTAVVDLKQFLADQDEPLSMLFSATAFDNSVSNGNTLYVLEKESGKLHAISTDAAGNTTYVSHEGCETDNIDRLVGASEKEIYALSKQGTLLVSTDECLSWQEESLDSDAALLPKQNINCTVHALRTNSDMSRVVLVGSVPGKEYAVVWMKVVDRDEPGAGRWMLVADGTTSSKGHALPTGQAQSVLAYGELDLSFGFDAEGGLDDILLSNDGGINWQADDAYAWPTDAAAQNVIAAAADDSNYLWVVLGGTGQIWRGRLNRLGWEAK